MPELPIGYDYGPPGSTNKKRSPPIPSGVTGTAYMFAYMIAYMMEISMTRMQDASLTPTFATDGVTVTNIQLKIKITNKVNKNSEQPNDYLDTECLANWWKDMMSARSLDVPKPSCTLPKVIANFTSDIPNKFEHATNVDRFLPMNNLNILDLSSKLLEHGTNVTIKIISDNPSTKPSTKPSQPLEYLLQYTYPIGFLGAALYALTSIISVDITSIIANKNISIVFNVIIGGCGYIGLCYFYDIPIIMLTTFFNPSVIKTSNAS